MLSLEWKATAIADLLAIVDYISDDNPDAAQALKDEIEANTSRLPENSSIGLVEWMAPARWWCVQTIWWSMQKMPAL